MRRTLLALALGLLVAGPVAAQEPPRDEARLDVEYRPGAEVSAEQLVLAWARRFGAIPLIDRQVSDIPVRFLSHVRGPMTWGAVKQILEFHGVKVVESRPSPAGPWLLRAVHDRNALNLLGGDPGRVVDAEDLPPGDPLVTAIVQLRHGAGQHIFALIRQLQARDHSRLATSTFVPGPDVLLITDTASRVRRYVEMAQALDVPGPERIVRLVQVEHADAAELAASLTQILTGLAAARTAVGVAPGGGAGPQVIAEPRTNQLALLGAPGDLDPVADLIRDLDRPLEDASARYRVYRCRHARSPYLRDKLGDLLSDGPGGGGGGGGEGDLSGAGAVVAGDPEGRRLQTRIVADERNNTLLIQAEPEVMDEVLRLLAELDTPKRRVAIEVEIWEINGPTDSLTIGVEVAGVPNAHPGSTRPGGLTSFGLSTPSFEAGPDGQITRFGRTPGVGEGLTAVLTRGSFDRIPIVLSAVQSTGRSTLINRPFAITNDHTEASFNLTDSRPVAEQTISGGGLSQTGVKFLDAETTLSITPHVNSEGNLTLETTITLSSFTEAAGPGGAPGKSSRSYTGEVTVPNGHYVVFGGLEIERETESEAKVPVLGDIPILGHLFKRWSRTRSRSKLYIFVRPSVLSEAGFSADRRLSEELRERAHVESGRDAWLPPVVPDRVRWPTGWDVQDEAFAVFGTGSADPLR